MGAEVTWRIDQGDCRELLQGMPAESVHIVVTSPPYWGLRDYGLPPLVWGGAEGCEHEWGEEQATTVGRSDGGRDIGGRGGNYQEEGPHQVAASQGAFCRHCHAWRGSLGLEPTPDCRRPFAELRDDLSEKERAYVMAELTRLDLIQEPPLESEGQP